MFFLGEIERHIQNTSKHNTLIGREKPSTIERHIQNTSKHNVSLQVSSNRTLKDTFKIHQNTTGECWCVCFHDWKTHSKYIKTQPRAEQTKRTSIERHIQNTSKHNRLMPMCLFPLIERHIQNTSKHNLSVWAAGLYQLKDTFKIHQNTTLAGNRGLNAALKDTFKIHQNTT